MSIQPSQVGVGAYTRPSADPNCHVPLPKIRWSGVTMKIGDAYMREKYPTYTC